MFRKILFTVLCALPLTIFAQDAKLAHVNYQAIIESMPELDSIESQIAQLNNQWKTVLNKMQEEYSTKLKEYQDKQATMSEGIKQALISEIQDIEQRINNFQQQSYTEMQKKQQELVAPVVEKVKKAIREVGAEGNYTYVLDAGGNSILYYSPKAVDLTAAVKKKLGLK